MTVYWKAAILAVVVALSFGSGFHFGGMGPRTQLEALRAAQAANVAKAVLAERASAATELARVNSILKEYQDAPPSPIVTGLAQRVLVYARAPVCPVPSAGADPGRAVSPAAQPAGDAELERLSQAVFDACSADAAELTALQQAWPR